MKNIYLLANDKSQNIYITSNEEIKDGDYIFWEGKIFKYREFMAMKTPVYTDYFKIILTTDEDLIADGVQAIDDTFLEWFVKNPHCENIEVEKVKHGKLTKYYLNNNVEIENIEKYKIIITKEESKQEKTFENVLDESLAKAKVLLEELRTMNNKQETLEEAAENKYIQGVYIINGIDIYKASRECFIEGAKWQSRIMYTEEEVFNALCSMPNFFNMTIPQQIVARKEWFEQFKKK